MRKQFECGIDLGTTNSCIAIINEENECEVIENNTDRMLVTPSAVQVSKTGRITVGQRAYTYPDGRFVRKEFKRDMGTDTIYTFPESGKNFSPIELSAEVLKMVKRDAEARTGKSIISSVITVPAAFQELQIKATKEAAELAGFESVILLQEPVAAAVAYGAKANNVGENWLVFDYGGGTLDVAVVSTKNGELACINNKGNNRMGGKDIDKAIYEKIILPELKKQYQIEKDLNGKARAKALFEIEKCKVELSKQNESIFELYDVYDEADNEIEFEFNINREQFDKTIEDLVDETIYIARDALIGANLYDSDLKKVILVGGSTFIPLVRDKLQKEFKVDLDSSLDPMTVVAKGAAMFASQNYFENSDKSDNNSHDISKGIGAQMEYDDTTLESTVTVFGKFTNYIDGAIDKIKFQSVEEGLWQGGWQELLDNENGIFEYELNIYNMRGDNNYVMSAIDKTGTIVKLNVSDVSIVYGGGLRLAAPPLPFNIGIMASDSTGNVIDWLLNKNTRLPSTGHGNYKLNKTLNPKEEDIFTLKVYEGEDRYNPSANHLIGDVKVNSKDLPKALAEGEEVEITIDVDESRVVAISAYIPKFDFNLAEEKLMGNNTQYTSLSNEIENAKCEFTQTRKKLKKMQENGTDIGDFEEKLDSLEKKSETFGKNVDNDDAQDFLDDFHDLKSKIINKERDTANKIQDEQDLQRISYFENRIAHYGSLSDREIFDDLKQKYNSENNESTKKYFINKMDELDCRVRWASFDWMRDCYYDWYKDNKNNKYKDPQKANYWDKKTYEAICNKDKDGLSTSLNNLISLRIFDKDDEDKRVFADIRI